MKSFIVTLLLCFVAHPRLLADDTKIRQAVEKGIVTGEFLSTLTPDDVPDKWKAQKVTKETPDSITQVYSRNGVRTLEVLWAKNWTGDKEQMFVATVYRADTRLVKIVHLGHSTSIMPSDAPKGFQVFTSIKDDDGSVTVTATDNKDSFIEGVVVKGRDTRLLDDLEYTKQALALTSIAKPLINAIQESMPKRMKKAGK